jgi:Uma2 family endonuclease
VRAASLARPSGSAESNYRVPDVLLVPPGYQDVGGWVEDGALLAVEILSPREEVVQKLEFYAARGLAEVIYIDWREKRIEVFRREGKTFMVVSADREGFVEVRAAALRLRRVERGRTGEAATALATATLEAEDARGGGELPGY